MQMSKILPVSIVAVVILSIPFMMPLFAETKNGQGIPLPAGRYAVAGQSASYTNGIYDFLVYKLDEGGNVIWRKYYGGIANEEAHSIRATADHGLLVAGYSTSYTQGVWDFLVYKIDANGTKLWRKNYGGIGIDYLSTAIPTSDNGYLLFGETSSYTHGDRDFLVYKVDGAGQKQWRRNYGGGNSEYVYLLWPTGDAACQTADGSYVFIGTTTSYSHGGYDFLVYKVDGSGAKLWRRNLGGSGNEQGYAIEQTPDGGYLVAGYSDTYSNGGEDMLVYKLNAAGVKEWRKNYGGSGNDRAFSLCPTADGGTAIAGYTDSYGTGGDFLIFKVDASGNKLWRKNYGSTGEECGQHLVPTSDGGLIICGYSDTITQGQEDFLVYKLNAGGQKQWRRNYGGASRDWAYCICEVEY